MTLYKFDSWEHNGRDDSDFYAVCYNTDSDKLERILTGTTRFASIGEVPAMLDPTPEVKSRVKELLTDMYFGVLRNIENRRVLEPEPSELQGKRVQLTAEVRNQRKETSPGAACPKCGGTGKWVNPHNSADKRTCFACKGRGHSLVWNKVKNEKGKPVWDEYPAGTVGECTGTGFYGKVYRNGYNRVGRHNTTAYVRLDTGVEIRVSCDKLRLAEEPASDEAILERAEQRAETLAVYPFFRSAGIRL